METTPVMATTAPSVSTLVVCTRPVASMARRVKGTPKLRPLKAGGSATFSES